MRFQLSSCPSPHSLPFLGEPLLPLGGDLFRSLEKGVLGRLIVPTAPAWRNVPILLADAPRNEPAEHEELAGCPHKLAELEAFTRGIHLAWISTHRDSPDICCPSASPHMHPVCRASIR
jgi:hypothetical protein